MKTFTIIAAATLFLMVSLETIDELMDPGPRVKPVSMVMAWTGVRLFLAFTGLLASVSVL